MKKGNVINLKKRFAGMLAMVLAMFMLMGNTAMAASYVTKADVLREGTYNNPGNVVVTSTVLNAGDTIECGFLYTDSSGSIKEAVISIDGYEILIKHPDEGGSEYEFPNGYRYRYTGCTQAGGGYGDYTKPVFYFEAIDDIPSNPQTPTVPVGPTGSVDPIPEPQPEPAHSHDYEMKRKDATEIEDGWIRLQCKYCGHVKEEGPLSAMTEFWMNSVDKVNKAAPGDNVVLESKIWYSMPDYVMEAIAGRRDITVTMKMKYEHKNYEIVISPEETVQYTDKYYGVLYLCQLYGGNIVE